MVARARGRKPPGWRSQQQREALARATLSKSDFFVLFKKSSLRSFTLFWECG
jgi:hypothetical protein